mmetsp:Transcript_3189/g.10656  ORF Transcript_3189/g.10656 Transcript_3189/m.10656 type:complete len:216 (-) Transcript_3189:231-878(-)
MPDDVLLVLVHGRRRRDVVAAVPRPARAHAVRPRVRPSAAVPSPDDRAAAAAVFVLGQRGHDVQPRDALQPHHPDRLLHHRRRLRAPHHLRRVVIRLPHERLRGPSHLLDERLVVPQPRGVRLRFRLVRHRVHRAGDFRDVLVGHVERRANDWEVPDVLLREELLPRREHENPLAALSRARGPPQPVNVLLPVRRDPDLHDERDVREVDPARGDV